MADKIKFFVQERCIGGYYNAANAKKRYHLVDSKTNTHWFIGDSEMECADYLVENKEWIVNKIYNRKTSAPKEEKAAV